MDDRTIEIYCNKIYKPYFAGYTSNGGLLLDDFICHKSDTLKHKMDADNTILDMIPPHYTDLMQPCGVRINKSLKDPLKKSVSSWRRMKNTGLTSGEQVPALSRYDALQWLKKIWYEFPNEIVQNSLKGCGSVFKDGIDYSMET